MQGRSPTTRRNWAPSSTNPLHPRDSRPRGRTLAPRQRTSAWLLSVKGRQPLHRETQHWPSIRRSDVDRPHLGALVRGPYREQFRRWIDRSTRDLEGTGHALKPDHQLGRQAFCSRRKIRKNLLAQSSAPSSRSWRRNSSGGASGSSFRGIPRRCLIACAEAPAYDREYLLPPGLGT
jgi:hypothetical protein